MARQPTAMEKEVFGHDVEIGEDGRPIEQGLGSGKKLTAQHLEARRLADQRKALVEDMKIARMTREQF